MSFWSSFSGDIIDGSEERSHSKGFELIPNNTTASSIIKKSELLKIQDSNDKFYQITYQLIDGDFKGSFVQQKIKCFDHDDKKRDRNLNMLFRLFKLCNYKPDHNSEPNNDDLINLNGNHIGIKIREWEYDGKQGNWVSEIHAVDDNFVSKTGIKTVFKQTIKTNDIEDYFGN